MAILSHEKGFSIIAVVVMMLMIAVMGQALVSMVGTENFSTVNQIRAVQAQYIAESGIERALYGLGSGTDCNLLSYNDALGAGTYATTGTSYNPASSTLSAAIAGGDSIIPMVSIAGYAPHGRVTIESEEIDYGKTSTLAADCAPFGTPCLPDVQRGVNGSTASAHGFAIPVTQNQCLIQSIATVAGAPTIAQRVIESGVSQSSGPGATVQSGIATSTTNGALTIIIPTAINMRQSFLMFNTRHNSNRPVGSMLRGRIASTTTLEFVRVTNEASPVPITIHWSVVGFSSGVRVQRGSLNQTSTVLNVPLATPIASLNQAFVTWSKTPAIGDQIWSQDDPIVGDLTAADNLQFRVNNVNGNHIIWWQVIEFTNPADIFVQRGTTSLTGNGPASLSVNITLPTPMDTAKTFVLAGYRTNGSGADVGRRMLRARLINATTITIDRSISGSSDPISEIVWQAVQLNNTTVQHGSQNFPVGGSNIVVTFNGSVNVANAGAISLEEAAAGLPEAVERNSIAFSFSPTITSNITPLTNNAWVVDVVGSRLNGTYTPGLGQTQGWQNSGNGTSASMSTKPVPTSGPNSMTQTHNSFSLQTVHILASVAPNSTAVPILYDAQSNNRASNTNTLTWPHVLGGGASRKLLVGITVGESNINSGDEDVLSVTYGGIPLSYIADVSVNFFFGRQHAELWYLDETNMPSGNSTTQVVPITTVDITRSVAFASVQAVGGQNMGRSPYNGDDIIGVGSVTMDLASNQITMRRANSADQADIGWFVVEFGHSGPGGIIDWLEVF